MICENGVYFARRVQMVHPTVVLALARRLEHRVDIPNWSLCLINIAFFKIISFWVIQNRGERIP